MEKLTRQEQKDRTRSGLVTEAELLFARQGISHTSTAEIAKALQVSHGTLFVHFPTREDLILAVVNEFGERLSSALGARCATDLDLHALLEGQLSVLAEFEDFYLRLISESQSLPAHIRSMVYAMNASLSYRFYRAAKGEMDRDQLKKMSQTQFFNTWMAMVHYTILNRDLFSEKTPILNEKGDELIRQFFLLIRNTSTKPSQKRRKP